MRTLAFCLLCLCSFSVQASDPCVAGADDQVELVLHSSRYVESKDLYYGLFRLTVPADHSDVHLSGISRDGVLRIPRIQTSIEFLDLNDQWNRLVTLPGSNIDVLDSRVVKAKSDILLEIPLFNRKVAQLSGSDLRLLIRDAKYSICIMSDAFHVMPQRSEPTHLESSYADR